MFGSSDFRSELVGEKKPNDVISISFLITDVFIHWYTDILVVLLMDNYSVLQKVHDSKLKVSWIK